MLRSVVVWSSGSLTQIRVRHCSDRSLAPVAQRKICFELLDLKDAVENLCSNTRTKYLAFLRLSDEVVEMKHELNELQKHISSHGILIQDLMSGVAIDAIDTEERTYPELKGTGYSTTDESSSFKSALSKRKAMLENQLIEISRQPSVGIIREAAATGRGGRRDVLLGKEKIQKVLLAMLTETMVMWLSNEEEFWGVLENESAPLRPVTNTFNIV
ncbi:hypothetical protein SASPL_150167 [Salvia splendens]|uniref:Uncharacterized protein n=1 Tax=Salvia splendens TaxID=180675 RepID=A0A8X8W635_SALSN|nr:hypothetical protein SASPL_150167 [Salvia splendens]